MYGEAPKNNTQYFSAALPLHTKPQKAQRPMLFTWAFAIEETLRLFTDYQTLGEQVILLLQFDIVNAIGQVFKFELVQ